MEDRTAEITVVIKCNASKMKEELEAVKKLAEDATEALTRLGDALVTVNSNERIESAFLSLLRDIRDLSTTDRS